VTIDFSGLDRTVERMANEEPVVEDHARKEFYTYIGHHIRHYRIRFGVTQTALAELIGRPGPTISHWEKGTKTISAFDLMVVSVALGVPVTALLPRGAE
jgi:DNA-binding XRE family transcriptional regulator